MATSRNDMGEMAMARANVYGLLADIFRQEPSEILLTNLRGPEFSGALKALDLSLEEMFSSASDTQLCEDLALEYARLFIGPGPRLSPHESLYIETMDGNENSLWSTQTVAVIKFMKAAGVAVNDQFDGLPDHISVELEFMQRLLEKEAEAWMSNDCELATNLLSIEQKFYDQHVSQWVPKFCDKVIEAADHIFYRQFSEVTKSFIVFEAENLMVQISLAEDVSGPIQVNAS